MMLLLSRVIEGYSSAFTYKTNEHIKPLQVFSDISLIMIILWKAPKNKRNLQPTFLKKDILEAVHIFQLSE